MSQSREAIPGAHDDRSSSSSIFDNSNDELDSILTSNWVDDELESMMLDWTFDDQKLVPDSSQIGDDQVATGTQCFSGSDPSLQATHQEAKGIAPLSDMFTSYLELDQKLVPDSSQIGDDQVATGTQCFSGSDPSLQATQEAKDIAPLSDMFTSYLELDQSFVNPEFFKRSPVWIPNYTVPISPGSMYQFPATTASFLSGLLNDEMYENNILRMFSCEPAQDLPVPPQKQTESLMMEEEAIHPGEPANPSIIISDQQQGAADHVVQPRRESTPVVFCPSVKDGYNWRKYGQKNVKESNSPRSYYKCTYPHCKMRKKEERSPQGNLTEIIYKGVHNHVQPNPSSSASSYLEHDAPLKKMSKDDVVEGDDTDSKRQKTEFNATETMRSSSRSARQVKYLVVVFADSDIINDGYRWRKYGSKVVKGNSNPRSYYRCTDSGCKARRLVERSPDDIKKLMMTYEGTHNHGVPGPKCSSIGGSSVKPSVLLPQANGSNLVPRFGCPDIVSLPRSLPNLPPATVNALGTVALAPLPTRMRMPNLPQLSSYSGFCGPLQPGMMTMEIPKLESAIQPPPAKTQLPLQPMN